MKMMKSTTAVWVALAATWAAILVPYLTPLIRPAEPDTHATVVVAPVVIMSASTAASSRVWINAPVTELVGSFTTTTATEVDCETACRADASCAGISWRSNACQSFTTIDGNTKHHQKTSHYFLDAFPQVLLNAACELSDEHIELEEGVFTDGADKIRDTTDCTVSISIPEAVWTRDSGVDVDCHSIVLSNGGSVTISTSAEVFAPWFKGSHEAVVTQRQFDVRLMYQGNFIAGIECAFKHNPYGRLKRELLSLKQSMVTLGRNSVMSQAAREQRVRQQGNSGVVRVRSGGRALQTYKHTSYTTVAAMFMHDHPQLRDTCGLGEISMVMNGVEFWTRHNDYRLLQPADSTEYHATEEIEFPPVPPAVLQAGAGESTTEGRVQKEVDEMREWFKAWKTQNKTHRDYTDYFKPVMVYMEGAWVLDNDKLTDPFKSDRHQIEADTWKKLQAAMRWSLASGIKDQSENLPFLPSAIHNMRGELGEVPEVVNWEYRMAAVPLKSEVPLSRFRVVDDDLHTRFARKRASRWTTSFEDSRSARFDVNPVSPEHAEAAYWPKSEFTYEFMDKLMSEVPGKDNRKADLYNPQYCEYLDFVKNNTCVDLNEGYYSRFFFTKTGADANGVARKQRGFSDPFIWAAKTTQSKVAQLETEVETGRWTYALPMEIFYMTPLHSWNPYNIRHLGPDEAVHQPPSDCDGMAVTPGEVYRNDPAKSRCAALAGVRRQTWFLTPEDFFSGDDAVLDPADTGRGGKSFRDPNDVVRAAMASGPRMLLPNIPGVGVVRTRYPIFPVHEHTSTQWKELKALQEVLGASDAEKFNMTHGGATLELTLFNGHTHTLDITEHQIYQESRSPGAIFTLLSSESASHQHSVKVVYSGEEGRFKLVEPLQCHPVCAATASPADVLVRHKLTGATSTSTATTYLHKYDVFVRFPLGLKALLADLKLFTSFRGSDVSIPVSVHSVDPIACDDAMFAVVSPSRKLAEVIAEPNAFNGVEALLAGLNSGDVSPNGNLCIRFSATDGAPRWSPTTGSTLEWQCGVGAGCEAHELNGNVY